MKTDIPGRATHDVLVEAESFADKGGWRVDQQFIHSMGSPYLIAHGMGMPVANARTRVRFPATGRYHPWVRTMNWAPGDWEAPGRFRVLIDGKAVATLFGTLTGWTWQSGGVVDIANTEVDIQLEDLTGFDGRCDAICFCSGDAPPPDDPATLPSWRRDRLGLPSVPPSAGTFDVVIVGAGIVGCAAAVAAAKQGLKVALVHDRPVPGGNASDEVRVHTEGIYGKGQAILAGLDTGHWPNGSEKAAPDMAKRLRTLEAETNIRLFFSFHVDGVTKEASRIASVDGCHIERAERLRFTAPLFIDCTGDGWIGCRAGAQFRYGRESVDTHGEAWEEHGELWSPKTSDRLTMGTSLLWNSEPTDAPVSFPAVPWALAVAGGQSATHGDWNWEYATHELHQIDDAEAIRDHMLRAIYGAFSNAKQDPKNANVRLKWVGFLCGRRESRRLMGDHVYTQKDALSRFDFPDTVAEEKREIDVHYQLEPGGFLSWALFRDTGGIYHIPFRCLYSRTIDNLMMAGRCFSCSHIGLGGPRVMLTTGQMGIAVGYAASLCRKYGTMPRDVGTTHIAELRALIGYGAKN